MENIIGQTCDQCGDIITADHDEAHQYYREAAWEWSDEDEPQRVPVPGVYCCCQACHDELEDGDRAAMMDAIERGEDYPD